MTRTAILAGSAQAVKTAWETRAAWNGADIALAGAALIGPGDAAPLKTVARAPIWEALDLVGAPGQALIIAEALGEGATKRAVLESAADAGMKVLLLREQRLRPLRLDDLIGRALRDVDWARIQGLVSGKRILITGGGGSIGSELARKISALNPAKLTLLDSSEHNLYKIGLELRAAKGALADVRDPRAVRRWFGAERPELVFHTAALKQVPLVEAFPSEGVATNVVGLRNVAEAAHAAGADLIFVSTDKAVEPWGVMGASKRLGELYCAALDRRGPQRALPVRLGNVLGSAGSVKPVFEAQLAAGGPLTVTDPQVTRFFLSIPQAADALLQAAAVGFEMQARGCALVIEMGEALPVVELAREVIRLDGLRPEIDVAIAFTGLRPGEKLHERLVASYESVEPAPAPGVVAATSRPRSLAELHEIMGRLALLAQEGADSAIVSELFNAVSEAPEEATDRARLERA